MTSESPLGPDLDLLAAELKQLEGEYTMFFAGQLPRPPWETRRRVESVFARWGKRRIDRSVDRFRFQTLQSRFTVFANRWDRALRAKEEGR